jgi:hypothetical protein
MNIQNNDSIMQDILSLINCTLLTVDMTPLCTKRPVPIIQIGKVAVNILNKQLWTADKGWSSRLGCWVWG